MATVAENRRIVAVCVAKAGGFVALRGKFLKRERIGREVVEGIWFGLANR